MQWSHFGKKHPSQRVTVRIQPEPSLIHIHNLFIYYFGWDTIVFGRWTVFYQSQDFPQGGSFPAPFLITGCSKPQPVLAIHIPILCWLRSNRKWILRIEYWMFAHGIGIGAEMENKVIDLYIYHPISLDLRPGLDLIWRRWEWCIVFSRLHICQL